LKVYVLTQVSVSKHNNALKRVNLNYALILSSVLHEELKLNCQIKDKEIILKINLHKYLKKKKICLEFLFLAFNLYKGLRCTRAIHDCLNQ
jgi:hypothetical protein